MKNKNGIYKIVSLGRKQKNSEIKTEHNILRNRLEFGKEFSILFYHVLKSYGSFYHRISF